MPPTALKLVASQTPESLIQLLARVAAGDRPAFAVLYQATSLKLFGIIFRILKRRNVAEDILQEVYVKIWERAGDFTATRGSPITWMATIARNRALDEARRDAHLISSEDVAHFDDIVTSEPNAFDQIEDREKYQRLTHCLNGIEEEKRQMVLLAYQHGVSRDLLAKKYNQPVATIKTWLRRSLQSLKQCLDT